MAEVRLTDLNIGKHLKITKNMQIFPNFESSVIFYGRTFTIGHKKNQHLMLMDKSSADLQYLSR